MKNPITRPFCPGAKSLCAAICLLLSVSPAKAQQYRFSAGVDAGSFQMAHARQDDGDHTLLRQIGFHFNYNINKRWTIGASAMCWWDVSNIGLRVGHGFPATVYQVQDRNMAPLGVITDRLDYSFYELYGQYNVLQQRHHTIYTGAGLSLITGTDNRMQPEWSNMDFGTPPDRGAEPERFTKMGGRAQAGYLYHIGAKGRWSAGADITARFAHELPLQLYYGISVNLNISCKSVKK